MIEMMILVAIGANLAGPWGERPVETCRRAVLELGRLPGLRVTAASRWYRSAPWPPSDQPDYVNGVVRLSGPPREGTADPGTIDFGTIKPGTIDPADLLRLLHAIEREGGRVRGVRDAARTLDLDIIDIDGQVREAPDPVLPHPRARQRAFVLLPLQEVAPDWIEPRVRQPVAALLADLQDGCGTGFGQLDWPTPYI